MVFQEFLLQVVVKTTEENLDILLLHIGEQYLQLCQAIGVYDGDIAETQDEDLVSFIEFLFNVQEVEHRSKEHGAVDLHNPYPLVILAKLLGEDQLVIDLGVHQGAEFHSVSHSLHEEDDSQHKSYRDSDGKVGQQGEYKGSE